MERTSLIPTGTNVTDVIEIYRKCPSVVSESTGTSALVLLGDQRLAFVSSIVEKIDQHARISLWLRLRLRPQISQAKATLTATLPPTPSLPGLLLRGHSPPLLKEDEKPELAPHTRSRTIFNPSRQDWEHHRSIFTQLYRSLPLRLVREIMIQDYGFVASERMYKIRIDKWGLYKYRRPRNRAHDRDQDTDADYEPPVDDVEGMSIPPPVEPLGAMLLVLPDQLQYLKLILVHLDCYYRSCVLGQDLAPFDMKFAGTDDGFADMGLLEIHDPSYAAISSAKSKRYQEARILLGDAHKKLLNSLRVQHPTLLPFLLEIICETSTTPEFNVSELFRQYVCELCSIVMGEYHSLTIILQLLGRVDFKLDTCAMILSRIQQLLSAEFGASQWQARRPVKVYCRVLRHLGRYDEVVRILPSAMGSYGTLEAPPQSELLGLLYELAWLIARGHGDREEAKALFAEILSLTELDARQGRISHFRIKAHRGLGVLAREDSCYHSSEQHFSIALDEARRSLGRRDSNTVRIGSELEDSLRQLGRSKEADLLCKERNEILCENEEAVEP